jgi:hypothetical protein
MTVWKSRVMAGAEEVAGASEINSPRRNKAPPSEQLTIRRAESSESVASETTAQVQSNGDRDEGVLVSQTTESTLESGGSGEVEEKSGPLVIAMTEESSLAMEIVE